MLNKLENFDSGSNYRFGDKLDVKNPKRSLFDLSHLVTTTYPKEGAIIPITCWETLLGDDFDIDVDALIRFQPLTVPPYSRSRIFFYGFWSAYSDLCDIFQVFMDKGMTGSYSGQLPSMDLAENFLCSSGATVAPDTMENYLGLPIGASFASLNGQVNILRWMMCARVWRDYFCCKDEYINDRILFPHDDSRFRLNSNGQLLSAKDNSKDFAFHKVGYNSFGGYEPAGSGTTAYFLGMWHEWAQDYFTSAKPFQQRGSAVGIPIQTDFSRLTLVQQAEFMKSMTSAYSSERQSFEDLYMHVPSGSGATPSPVMLNDSGDDSINAPINLQMKAYLEAMNVRLANSATNPIWATVNVADMRTSIINQLELERLAHTDGTYGQFGISFFGEKPKSAYDYRPIYIGGTYKNILFSQVLQTSETSGTNYLGAYAGHGIAGINNGRIGHIHCNDYGMIMIYAVILPDTYYSQGLDKSLTRLTQEEFFLPGREKLGMQPILNKEIFFSGTSSQDNSLWAYQDSWDEYRYMPNRVSGKIADPSSSSWFPYTQSRKFNSLPNWGHNFSTLQNNVRNSFYTSNSEDICSMQVQINVRAVRPLPYRPTVGQIIN